MVPKAYPTAITYKPATVKRYQNEREGSFLIEFCWCCKGV